MSEKFIFSRARDVILRTIKPYCPILAVFARPMQGFTLWLPVLGKWAMQPPVTASEQFLTVRRGWLVKLSLGVTDDGYGPRGRFPGQTPNNNPNPNPNSIPIYCKENGYVGNGDMGNGHVGRHDRRLHGPLYLERSSRSVHCIRLMNAPKTCCYPVNTQWGCGG